MARSRSARAHLVTNHITAGNRSPACKASVPPNIMSPSNSPVSPENSAASSSSGTTISTGATLPCLTNGSAPTRGSVPFASGWCWSFGLTNLRNVVTPGLRSCPRRWLPALCVTRFAVLIGPRFRGERAITITGSPFFRDWQMFSDRFRYAFTVIHVVGRSFHCCVRLSKYRLVLAILNELAWGMPSLLNCVGLRPHIR